jgi:hypothetical protein
VIGLGLKYIFKVSSKIFPLKQITKLRMKTAHEVGDLYSAIDEVLDKMQYFNRRFENYVRDQFLSVGMRDIIRDILVTYLQIITFSIERMKSYRIGTFP